MHDSVSSDGMHPSARRWSIRAAVIVGAAASIATPQKKWTLEGEVSSAANDASRDRRLVVSASREPELYVRRGRVADRSWPKETVAAWPATVTFELPAGTTIDRLAIVKGCGGGLCNDKCEVPAGEYLRIDRVDLTSWTLASGDRSLARVMGKPGPRARIEVDASREPSLEVTAPGTTYRPQIEARGFANGRATFLLDFGSYRGTGEVQTVWSVRASIGAACTGVCAVPAGEHVAIASVGDE